VNCPFCGAQLPAGAPFCPACHQSLVEKATIPIPRPWRRKTGLLALFFLLFLLTGAVLLRSDPEPQPQTEVPAAEPVAQPVEAAPLPEAPAPQILAAETKLTYDTGTDTYELFLSSSSGEYANEGTYVTTLNPGQGCFTPLLLVVQKDGHDARAEFTELLERAEVRVVCVSGEAMTCGQPAYDAEKPLGTLTVRVHMPENSEESQIFWTLTMKNGDQLYFRQTFVKQTRPLYIYRCEEVPMDTDEALDALLAQILEETPEDAYIQIHLPAAVYRTHHVFKHRSYELLGCIDKDLQTEFRNTVTFESDHTVQHNLQNLQILGSGRGCGVESDQYLYLHGCTVQDWETGLSIFEKGSVCLERTTVRNNGVGLLWDSPNHSFLKQDNPSNLFLDNGVAIHIRQIPGNTPLTFPGTRFAGNGTHIQNDIAYPLDLTGASFD